MRQCLRTKSRGGGGGRRKEGREGKEGPQENFIYLLFLLSPDLSLGLHYAQTCTSLFE